MKNIIKHFEKKLDNLNVSNDFSSDFDDFQSILKLKSNELYNICSKKIKSSDEKSKIIYFRHKRQIFFITDLKSLINKKTQFNIDSSNLLKFETEGNLNNKNYSSRDGKCVIRCHVEHVWCDGKRIICDVKIT